MEKLYAISPLDGRYHSKVEPLRDYFSESALINHRIMVECEYFIFLISYLKSKGYPLKQLSKKETEYIREIYNLKDKNAFEVKKIEFQGDGKIKPTNHDVKAVEYYLKKTFENKIKNNLELIHFGLTSEDTNNIAYSLMISGFIMDVFLKETEKILKILMEFSLKHASSVFPARTHGQIASPTTFGKEMRNFYERIKRQNDFIKDHRIMVKLNGAVGNYNSFVSAFPDIDWTDFSSRFIKHINTQFNYNLEINLYTTQIESHDSWIELFDRVRHLNSILIGLCQDIWRYISDDLIILRPVDGEIGSSTMPHKINPINFENSEGNLQFANSMLEFFSSKFSVSRLQRDLTDSTVERNIGVAFGHSILAYNSFITGMSKITLNELMAARIVDEHPEVYAEAIQTILRKYGIKNAYEMMKDLTRGHRITKKEIENFIDRLQINEKIKKEIQKAVSLPYTGIASMLAKKTKIKN
ncbi:MAG: adenylosuccinate lyase [Elusimicrobiales bacterium]|jgi:adenylosuccinate lyase|nr:adenylosuccinate lyase [Elusimicrobiales bacterium]